MNKGTIFIIVGGGFVLLYLAFSFLPLKPGEDTVLFIESNTDWTGVIVDPTTSTNSFDGQGDWKFSIPCVNSGIISVSFQKQSAGGFLNLKLVQNGKVLNRASTSAQYGVAGFAAT